MRLTATYVRDGDRILAFHEDRLIAHGKHFAEVEKTAVEYLDSLRKKEDADIAKKARAVATHVTTPNGLKGEILGKVQGQWGEQITVRWENGRIAKYDTDGHPWDSMKYTAEEKQYDSALDYLETTLNESAEPNRPGLVARIQTLVGLVAKAAAVIAGGKDDEKKVHQIVLAAEHEKLEVKEALAHLESADAEAFRAPAPFDTRVAEQADLGQSGKNNWLDETVNDMIVEAESQDFDKLLAEEPGQFTAGLETAALADTGVTSEMAASHIRSKTAGLVGKDIDTFRTQFLAKVESARKAELVYRTEEAKKAESQKVAAVEESESQVGDEGLFL